MVKLQKDYDVIKQIQACHFFLYHDQANLLVLLIILLNILASTFVDKFLGYIGDIGMIGKHNCLFCKINILGVGVQWCALVSTHSSPASGYLAKTKRFSNMYWATVWIDIIYNIFDLCFNSCYNLCMYTNQQKVRNTWESFLSFNLVTRFANYSGCLQIKIPSISKVPQFLRLEDSFGKKYYSTFLWINLAYNVNQDHVVSTL